MIKQSYKFLTALFLLITSPLLIANISESAEPISIASDEAEYNTHTGVARYLGNVKFDYSFPFLDGLKLVMNLGS